MPPVFRPWFAALGAILLLAVTPAAAAELKIGWMDAQQVLDETKAGAAIKKRIETFVESRQKIIDLEEEELSALEAKLKEQMPLLSDQAKREKEAEFRRKLLKLNEKAGELTREIEQKKVELLEEFNNILLRAVEKVAKEGGYAYILSQGRESSLLYGDPDMELTGQVKKAVDAESR